MTLEPPDFLLQDKPVRVRFSPRERQRITEHLDIIQGHKCALCPTSTGLEIDHKNGLEANRLTDYRWLCKSCNLSQRALNGTARLDCVRVQATDPDPLAINREKEPQWLSFMRDQLGHGPVLKRVLLPNSAYHCNISPATANRYLVKHGSGLGPFRVIQDKLRGEVLVDLRAAE